MRFLFVVPPLTGHIAPLRTVAAVLAGRGHDVAWCGPEPATTALAGGLTFPAGESAPFAPDLRPAGLRGFAALHHLWERYLVPLADVMAPGVGTAVAAFSPDVLVVDQQALAGALVARRCGLPWATSASTSTELGDPLGALPKIAAWLDGLEDGLRARHGVAAGELRFSPRLVLTFTTRAFAGPPAARLVDRLRYVGPVPDPGSTVDFPWAALDGRPLVLVTLGTANAETGHRFLTECVAALTGLPDVRGVVVDPTGELVSEDVLLARRVPQVALLRRAAVVVCHGGHNTVCEALAEGVPLVVAPIRDDQSMLAQQVVAAEAGIRLRFDRAKATDLMAAITTVLADSRYRAGAVRMRDSFAGAGGAEAAADHLETLA